MSRQLLPNLDLQDAFAVVESQYRALTGRLKAAETRKMDFTNLKGLLEKEGRELLRTLLQAHLDHRDPGDVGESLEPASGQRLTHKRMGSRQIESIFGKVELGWVATLLVATKVSFRRMEA